jgi:hypothetical protein
MTYSAICLSFSSKLLSQGGWNIPLKEKTLVCPSVTPPSFPWQKIQERSTYSIFCSPRCCSMPSGKGSALPYPVLSWMGQTTRKTTITEAWENDAGHLEEWHLLWAWGLQSADIIGIESVGTREDYLGEEVLPDKWLREASSWADAEATGLLGLGFTWKLFS